jgi:Peptidase C10 family/Spi protease inhibitor/Secretion system C-terminal sorting domain
VVHSLFLRLPNQVFILKTNYFMLKLFRVIPVLLCFCFAITSYGKTVDENTAKTIGSHFLKSVGVQSVQSESDLVTSYVAATTVLGNVIKDYYVFNDVAGKAFVMVAADDIVIPILAYSNEGAFDINHSNPSALDWIDGYKNQITYVIEHEIAPQAGTAERWNDLKTVASHTGAKTTAVTPLITTKWDQAPYYNYLCPGVGSSKAVTGCVATAMAQIMKFWNWPTIGTGYHTYTPASYSTISADFGNTVYNWIGMPNSVTSNNNAVGTLMLHCGIAVEMDYSPTGSGSYVINYECWNHPPNCAEYALKTYFHYKPTLKGVPRSGETGYFPVAAMSTAAWIAMIKAELDAGRPVLYSGSSTTAGGHAWVCDGYNSTSMMHFNFGWSGASDGYYTVDNINPAALGIGGGGGNFNADQCVIIGIQPDPFPTSTTGNLKLLKHLDCTTSCPMNYLTMFSIVTKIGNGGTTQFKGDFCAQVYDSTDVNLVSTVQTLTAQTINAGDSTAMLTFTATANTVWGMIPGRYAIRIMYRPTGTTTWTAVPDNGTFINYNMLAVKNYQLIQLWDSIHVAGGSHFIPHLSPMSYTTKIVNFGGTNFNGTITGEMINLNTGNFYTVQSLFSQSIASNNFGTFTFSMLSATMPSGPYVMVVQHQPGGTGGYIVTGSNVFLNPIRINITSTTDMEEPKLTDETVVLFPNPTSQMLNIDLHGGTVNEVVISDIQGREMQKLTPVAGESLISVPVSNYAAGVYLVQLHSGADVITKKVVITR